MDVSKIKGGGSGGHGDGKRRKGAHAQGDAASLLAHGGDPASLLPLLEGGGGVRKLNIKASRKAKDVRVVRWDARDDGTMRVTVVNANGVPFTGVVAVDQQIIAEGGTKRKRGNSHASGTKAGADAGGGGGGGKEGPRGSKTLDELNKLVGGGGKEGGHAGASKRAKGEAGEANGHGVGSRSASGGGGGGGGGGGRGGGG